jgi:hypothetical protein
MRSSRFHLLLSVSALGLMLACNGGSSSPAPVPPAPVIASFVASPTSITVGGSAQLTASFSNGTGVVTPGSLAITSGTPINVNPAVTTTYTLTVTGSGGNATATATVTVNPQHLYVADDRASGQIWVYTLPLNASSTPVFSFSYPSGVGVAVNANGDLAAANNSGGLNIFPAPLSASSVASASFANAGSPNMQLAFGPSGKLFACTQGAKVNVFTGPFTDSTVFSSQITDAGVLTSFGVAFDAQANLYLAGSGTHVDVLPSEGSGAASVGITVPVGAALRQIAVGGGQLFMANVGNGQHSVFVFTLPITNSSAPIATITTGMNAPEAVAVDAAGNLYVGNLGDGTIKMFAPPFSSSSAPALSITTSAVIFGMAIGK